jgi:hypothetical protein
MTKLSLAAAGNASDTLLHNDTTMHMLPTANDTSDHGNPLTNASYRFIALPTDDNDDNITMTNTHQDNNSHETLDKTYPNKTTIFECEPDSMTPTAPQNETQPCLSSLHNHYIRNWADLENDNDDDAATLLAALLSQRFL